MSTASVPYIASCPACGRDAHWRSVMHRIDLPEDYAGGRVATGVRAECDCTCEPVELAAA